MFKKSIGYLLIQKSCDYWVLISLYAGISNWSIFKILYQINSVLIISY